MPWAMDTFWCIETVSGGAPMMPAIRLPSATFISHQPSPHARTPRAAQVSAYSRRLS